MQALQEPTSMFHCAVVEPELDAQRKPAAIATCKVRVSHEQGLHLRPCMVIVTVVSKYRAKVMVRKGSQAVEAASILELLTLAASHGTELVLSATGAESQEALDAVAGLFANGFQA